MLPLVKARPALGLIAIIASSALTLGYAAQSMIFG